MMRQYITGLLLFIAAAVLSACGSPEDKTLSNIETIEGETIPALTETLQNLIDFESEQSGLFNESIADESLDNFKNDQSELYNNLNERTELANSLEEIETDLKSAAEDFKSYDVDDSSELNEEMLTNLSDTSAGLAESLQAVRRGYQDIKNSEISFFESLAADGADYTVMTEGIASVNEQHEQISEHYTQINEQLAEIRSYGNTVKQALGEETDGETASLEETNTENSGADSKAETAYIVDGETSSIVPADEHTDAKAVLLTIDDAPDQNAVDMAKTLKNLDVPAIFFVNGMFIESEEGQSMLKEIHDLGFEIGNHTYNHFNMQELTPEDVRLEIADTSDLIEEAIGERPRFFRAPFGVNSEASIKVAEEENMTVMNWTYGFDWEPDYQESSALADIMVNTEMLSDGANLLMHDRSWTAEALPDIVTGIQDKGYSFIDPALISSEGGVTE